MQLLTPHPHDEGRPQRSMTEEMAASIKWWRQHRGLSQAELVAIMDEDLGYPMDRVTLSKIEQGGTRTENLSIRDLVVLAAALDVPPLLLFLPLGENVDVQLTPKVALDPYLTLRWFAGQEPFCMRAGGDGGNYARNPSKWGEAARTVRLFDDWRTYVEATGETWRRLRTARRALGDGVTTLDIATGEQVPASSPEEVRALEAAFDLALTSLMQHRRYMREAGIELEPIAEGSTWALRASELGLSDEPRGNVGGYR